MRLLLMVVLLAAPALTFAGFIKGYYCGSGILSTLASFLASTTCNREMLNLCCEAHDNCYDELATNNTREACDQVFCQCAQTAEETDICKWWIGVTHCQVVRSFGDRIYSRIRRLRLD